MLFMVARQNGSEGVGRGFRKWAVVHSSGVYLCFEEVSHTGDAYLDELVVLSADHGQIL